MRGMRTAKKNKRARRCAVLRRQGCLRVSCERNLGVDPGENRKLCGDRLDERVARGITATSGLRTNSERDRSSPGPSERMMERVSGASAAFSGCYVEHPPPFHHPIGTEF